MIRYNLEDVRRQFEITEKDALGLCVFLMNMEAGDVLTAKFVKITKSSDSSFEISHAEGVEELVADLMTAPEVALRRDIFGPENPER